MHRGNFSAVARWKRICASLAVASLVAVCALHCDSGKTTGPQTPAAALTIVSPAVGASFSLSDTIPFTWVANIDSFVSLSNINSILKQYSPDSGAYWYDMAVKPGSAVRDSTKYQLTWTGLDTTMFNNTTGVNFTKADLLNRDVWLRVVSYPPHSKYGYLKSIRFHE